MKRYLLFLLVLLLGLVSCEHAETDVKDPGSWKNISVHYTEIELNIDENYFIHDGVKVEIPTKKMEKLKEKDEHDFIYEYRKRENLLYNGETVLEIEFVKLNHESPEKLSEYFSIDVTLLDIDSKVLIQDEAINDYYFKYDFNDDYNNYCYFKISKNNINKLKDGSFNEIRLGLDILEHIDNTKSFKVRTEDGITNVGYYGDVEIYYNPDYNK